MENLDPSLFDRCENLVSLSSALLAHYGVRPFHAPMEKALSLFEGHRKIAVFLFDALGESPLERNGKASNEFLSHALFPLWSVNPATTVAATTSFLTAKYPIETGYLGWSLYFEELGYPVDVFPNANSLTGEKLPIDDYMAKACPTTKIDALLREKGVKAKLLFPNSIEEGGPKNLKEQFEAASAFFDEGGEFLYSYYGEPDHSMHEKGVVARKIKSLIKKMGKFVSRFAKEHPDVLVLALADHGMADVICRDLSAYPSLEECLERPISLEGRTVNFFVKGEKRAFFEEEFPKHFPSFHLLSLKDALERGYFGEGEPSPRSLSFLGDYLALAKGNEVLLDGSQKPLRVVRGHHAGITEEERKILLCAWNR